MMTFATGIVAGVVLKTLVPMPWLDDPVRAGWRWLRDKVRGIGNADAA